jgi:DNA-directed RNA polymerase specialized sigma24 family protein
MANNRPLPAQPEGSALDNVPAPREGAAFDAERFAAVWPAVEDRIHRMLAKRHCLPADRADITQDTAERLLLRRIPFTDANDLGRYAVTAAHHAWVDQVRKRRPTVEISAASEIPLTGNFTTPSAKIRALDKVLADLTDEETQLLHGEVLTPQTRQDAIRMNVRRHRLRMRLRRVIGGLLALATVAGAPAASQVGRAGAPSSNRTIAAHYWALAPLGTAPADETYRR